MTDDGLLIPGISRRGHIAPVVPRAQLRIVTEHPCARRHQNPASFAACVWPGALVSGRGFLALVVQCEEARVVLMERLRWAHTIRAEYAVFGCGPNCTGQHELVARDVDGSIDQPDPALRAQRPTPEEPR